MMRGAVLRPLAGLTALALLTGCAWLRPGTSALERQLSVMATQMGTSLISDLLITADPDQTAARFRLPGEDAWLGATRLAEWPEDDGRLPRSGVLVERLPYAGLDAQLSQLETECQDSPRIVAFVAPSGSVFAESRCGLGSAEQVLATWVDGVQSAAPALDLTTAEGYQTLHDELVAAMPGRYIYQIGIPGAGSTHQRVNVQGRAWLLPDQTACLVRYSRWLDAEPGLPLREFACDGKGSQTRGSDKQETWELSELTGAQLHQAIDEALAASGFAAEQVDYYLVMKLFYQYVVAVRTLDDEWFEYEF